MFVCFLLLSFVFYCFLLSSLGVFFLFSFRYLFVFFLFFLFFFFCSYSFVFSLFPFVFYCFSCLLLFSFVFSPVLSLVFLCFPLFSPVLSCLVGPGRSCWSWSRLSSLRSDFDGAPRIQTRSAGTLSLRARDERKCEWCRMSISCSQQFKANISKLVVSQTRSNWSEKQQLFAWFGMLRRARGRSLRLLRATHDEVRG